MSFFKTTQADPTARTDLSPTGIRARPGEFPPVDVSPGRRCHGTIDSPFPGAARLEEADFSSHVRLPKDVFVDTACDRAGLEPFYGDLLLKWEVGRHDLEGAPFFIYDEVGREIDDHLYSRGEIAHRLLALGGDKPVVAKLRGERNVRLSTLSELADGTRFHYRAYFSSTVNTYRYLVPLISAAFGGRYSVKTTLGGESGPMILVTDSFGAEDFKGELLVLSGAIPLVILRASSVADDETLARLGDDLASGCRFPTLPGVVQKGRYIGTGKYPSIEYAEPLWFVLRQWISLGMMQLCPQKGHLSVTERGQRLLGLMTARLFDPDARLRWADPETTLLSPAHEASVKRWNSAFYGEMRRLALRHVKEGRASGVTDFDNPFD